MSLDHAILGYLNYAPASGYELKRKFDLSVQHFWPANQSQIYRTLSRLNEKGLIEVDVIHQEERPDRKEYSITTTGKKELADWLNQPLTSPPTRSAGLVQVFFAGQLPDGKILERFEVFRESLLQQKAVLDQIPTQWAILESDTDSKREAWFWNQTIVLGYRSLQANLDWAEAIINSIRNGEVPEQ